MSTVFFDGVCGLCDRLTRFVLDHDRANQFRFAALQSDVARSMLGTVDVDDLDSVVVLTEGGERLEKTRAVFFILRELGGPWRLFAILDSLPRGFLDWGYDFVARHRFAWFGKLDTCRIPTADERAKFL